jgi:hypothetical protein
VALLCNDVLNDVSYALLETIVSGTLGTAVVAPGAATVTPSSMQGIYLGAQVLVGISGGNLEVVTVSGVAATTFTATFANTHLNTDPIAGATFSSGQTNVNLWTQSEMLLYAADVQNEYLEKTRLIYLNDTGAFTNGVRIYTQPAACIRLERVAVAGNELQDTSQWDQDFITTSWETQTGTPLTWFQDKLAPTQFGVAPVPTGSLTPDLWYSQKNPNPLTLISTFLLPDPLLTYIKYGVLAAAWSKAGEQRDPTRAAYAQQRFSIGVRIGSRFMDSVEASLNFSIPQS